MIRVVQTNGYTSEARNYIILSETNCVCIAFEVWISKVCWPTRIGEVDKYLIFLLVSQLSSSLCSASRRRVELIKCMLPYLLSS